LHGQNELTGLCVLSIIYSRGRSSYRFLTITDKIIMSVIMAVMVMAAAIAAVAMVIFNVKIPM
jgi:hypothetical protein